jgi:oxygen-independent coproporphyrinogen-3 oxidase
VITQLMCNFYVDRDAVEAQFGVSFDEYFRNELDELSSGGGPVADGFLALGERALRVTPRGRLFVRNICMTFDRYLPAHAGQRVFSRTI